MNKLIIVSGIALIITVLGAFLYSNHNRKHPENFVQTFGETSLHSNQSSTTENVENRHIQDLQKIDQSHDHIEKGDILFRAENFEKAAKEYEQAYAINAGYSKAVSGLLLVQTYERLGLNDSGINIIDQMIDNGYLSENGIKNAQEIRTRLLAAMQTQQPEANRTPSGAQTGRRPAGKGKQSDFR